MATKWQVRTKALSRGGKIVTSLIAADNVQPIEAGGLAFLDQGGFVVALIQKDSWIDVVRVP